MPPSTGCSWSMPSNGGEPERAPARDLAHPHPGRAHHHGGAQPARPVGPHGHHALRLWPALQPLAAQEPDAPDLVLPEGWAETLYVPPLRSRFLLQTAQAWERIGAGFSLPFAGPPHRRGDEAALPAGGAVPGGAAALARSPVSSSPGAPASAVTYSLDFRGFCGSNAGLA